MPPRKKKKTKAAGSTEVPPTVQVTINPKEYDDDDEGTEEREVDEDALGYEGEYDCVRVFSASITVNGETAGSVNAMLVDRPSSFHVACDAESAELQMVGCALFGNRGAPRHATLKADPDAATGGFLYIGSFSLSAEHRVDGATDVGAAALAAFLALPALAGRWTAAAYIADSRAGMTQQEQMEDERTPRRGPFEEPSAEEMTARKVTFARGAAADARQFLRVGFEGAFTPGSKTCEIYIATRAMAAGPLRTHAEALAVNLEPPPPATVAHGPSPSGVDSELLECVVSRLSLAGASSLESSEQQRAFLREVDQVIARGGHPSRAHALHAAASGGVPAAVFQQLVARGADVNGRNHQGLTPLMYAAATAPGRVSRFSPVPSPAVVSALVALGADLGLTDDSGVTALGHFYSASQNMSDFTATFGLAGFGGAGAGPDPALERLLMPRGGPTAADSEKLNGGTYSDDDDEEDGDY